MRLALLLVGCGDIQSGTGTADGYVQYYVNTEGTKLLQDTLLKVDGTGSIIVDVAKEDYAYVQEQKGALLEEAGMQSGSVEIVSDAALARAQCMIETEGGVYDCSLDTELAELKRRLMLLAYQKS